MTGREQTVAVELSSHPLYLWDAAILRRETLDEGTVESLAVLDEVLVALYHLAQLDRLLAPVVGTKLASSVLRHHQTR